MTTQEYTAPEAGLSAPDRADLADRWLPTIAQIRRAVQLRLEPDLAPIEYADAPQQPSLFDTDMEKARALESATTAEEPHSAAPAASQMALVPYFSAEHPLAISMRQGLLLIVVMALFSGLLPFAWNWYTSVRLDTIPPFVEIAQFAAHQDDVARDPNSGLTVLADTAGTLVGLQPQAPTWLAAGLLALGEWINWPLRWLALWLVYGLGVFVICVLFGSTTTLQHFFAATSYAAVPLLLSGLGFLPFVGALALLAGWIWAAIVYAVAVRSITGLDTMRTVLSIVAPAALIALASFVFILGMVALTLQFAI